MYGLECDGRKGTAFGRRRLWRSAAAARHRAPSSPMRDRAFAPGSLHPHLHGVKLPVSGPVRCEREDEIVIEVASTACVNARRQVGVVHAGRSPGLFGDRSQQGVVVGRAGMGSTA